MTPTAGPRHGARLVLKGAAGSQQAPAKLEQTATLRHLEVA